MWPPSTRDRFHFPPHPHTLTTSSHAATDPDTVMLPAHSTLDTKHGLSVAADALAASSRTLASVTVVPTTDTMALWLASAAA